MRRFAVLAVAAIALVAMLPARARTLPAPPSGGVPAVRGVVHVHTNRSDGTGSIDDVIRAAATAGLKFVIVTDHGDATRAPDLPDYRDGVLYIDAVEISTRDGHLVALGLPRAPYPLGGEGRDVVDDIHRMGGLAIAAHPGSSKPELQWTDWSASLDGLEWLNADSEWRDERPWTLARALLTYPFRPPQALALLLDRPEGVIRRWDDLAQHRRVAGLAAVDAHARVGVRSLGEPYDTAGSLHFPSYVNSFREFSVELSNARLNGNAEADARTVIDAIREGAFYSTVDALAGPAALSVAAGGEERAHLHVEAQAPGAATITLFRDGAPVATAQGGQLDHDASTAPGVYRVEVALPGSPGTPPVPWLMSNPIYVKRAPDGSPPQPQSPPRTSATLYNGGPARGWTIEKSASSDAAMDVIGALPGSQLRLRFAISGTAADSPYVAFVASAGPAIAMYDRIGFTARADRPMRLSIQLRASAGEGERWHRSVYLDQTPRTIDLPFADFRPRGTTTSAQPVLSKVDAILFVVDTVNAKIGSNGQVQIDDVRLAR
ncbi:MAG TPA: CehA/McbA family metallohydrolase [Vicinamibacterales bacterium]|nr:CehA/McbA family metallohydrolase [Vicinamibacterales bacterium]